MSNSGDIRGGRVWARMVSYVKNRDPQCKLQLEGCTGKSETADHIIPVKDGGKNLPNNLQGTCQACNKKRGDKPLEEILPVSGEEQPQNTSQEAAGADLRPSQGLRLLFDGSEKPSHRKLLEGMGVTQFAWSFWRAYRRGFPKTKPYMLIDYFPDDAEIYVDSGWIQAAENLDGDDLAEYVKAYDQFLENNLWRISGATELHGIAVLDHDLWPVWTPEQGVSALFEVAERSSDVALPNQALEDPVIQTRIGALHRQFKTRFHAQNVANPDTLKNVPLATASTISWASPQMRGETIVWDGSRLVRYQAKMKKQARSRYKAVVEKAGLSHEKILADDATEVTKLAIWSYMQLEKSMSKKNPFHVHEGGEGGQIADIRQYLPSEGSEDSEGGAVDSSALATRNPDLTSVGRAPETRKAQDRRFLPVMGIDIREETEYVDGVPTLREKAHLTSNHASLRQCNSCVIAANCPAFKPDSECAFSLPVEVNTKDQLKSILNTMIEIQGQRVAFARYAEELNGGYPDPNLSQEMDRFFRMVKNVKELESNNEFVRLTVERQQAGGVLSSIFGERAQAVNQLENPTTSDTIIGKVLDPDS